MSKTLTHLAQHYADVLSKPNNVESFVLRIVQIGEGALRTGKVVSKLPLETGGIKTFCAFGPLVFHHSGGQISWPSTEKAVGPETEGFYAGFLCPRPAGAPPQRNGNFRELQLERSRCQKNRSLGQRARGHKIVTPRAARRHNFFFCLFLLSIFLKNQSFWG